MRNWVKYGLLVVGLLLMALSGLAQNHFQKRVVGNFQHNFQHSTHVKTADDGFWILGKSSFTAGPGENYIIKTDSLGDTLFVKQYKYGASAGSSRTGFHSIVEAPNGGVYLVGVIDVPTALIREFLLVTKLDADGNIEWTNAYTGENYKQPYACLHNGVLHIGGIMAIGYTPNNDKTAYLIRISADGTLLSNDFREVNHKEEITGITVSQSGITILSGVTYRLNSKGNALMITIDPGGNLRYFNDINISTAGTYSRADGVTSWGDDIYLTGQLFGDDENKGFVMKIENPMQTAGERVILGANYDVGLFDIKRTSNTTIISGNGTVLVNSSEKARNLIATLDNNFDVKWAKVYGDDEGYKWLSSLDIRPNGDITATGWLSLNHFYGISIIRASSTGFTGCLEEDYPLTTDKASLNYQQYVPDGVAPYVSDFAAGINLQGVTDFEIEKVCKVDSCKASFELNKDSICANTCITINNTSTNATKWQWGFSDGSPNTFSGQNPNQVCFTTTGSKKIKLLVSNALNSDSVEKIIYVHPKANANAGADTTICRGQQIRLQGSGGIVYDWSPTNFKNSPSLPNPRVNPDSTIRYYLTVLDSNNCQDKDSVLVSIVQPPTTVTVDSTICEDKTITINAQNIGFSYLWSTGTTQQVTTLDTGKHFVVLSNSCFTDTSYYIITGKDCNPLYYIPTAFSPNGDGLNDVFSVYGDNIANIEMTIYNRWGEVMFKDKGISPAWDGGYKNSICPANQYLYIIELQDYTGKKYNEKGTITLLR